jgi:hypothetical protein
MSEMIGNKNAEKWTFEEAEKLLLEAVEISDKDGFDFIGEVAKHQKTYHDVYSYLVDKFTQLKPLLKQLKRNCETNCFSSGKRGNIVPSMAIMNLKSNHGWTDRVENTVEGGENPVKTQSISPITWVDDDED